MSKNEVSKLLQERIIEADSIIKKAYLLHPNSIYISNSLGKDSAVVAHLAEQNGITKQYFFNTGVEPKESIKLLKQLKREGKDITVLSPKKTYKQTLFDKGFPIGTKESVKGKEEIEMILKKGITTNNVRTLFKRVTGLNALGIGSKYTHSKFSAPLWVFEAMVKNIPLTQKCCQTLKKDIRDSINGFALTGEMMSESMLRETSIIAHGVIQKGKAVPLYNWDDDLVWEYINYYDIPVSKAYDRPNQTRTGCESCLMGAKFDWRNGIDRLEEWAIKYPKQYKAHMKYKHHSGMTFEIAIKEMKQILLHTDYLVANGKKLEILLLLKSTLDESNIEYNKVALGAIINHTRKQIKILLRRKIKTLIQKAKKL